MRGAVDGVRRPAGWLHHCRTRKAHGVSWCGAVTATHFLGCRGVHSIIFPVSGAGLQLALSHGPPNGEAQLTIHHRRSLLEHLRGQLAVDWWGHHGIAHWARVRANGLMLARDTGANRHVVELCAFFHDARRINEYDDEDHGARGGELAKRLRGRYFDATDDEMDLLA